MYIQNVEPSIVDISQLILKEGAASFLRVGLRVSQLKHHYKSTTVLSTPSNPPVRPSIFFLCALRQCLNTCDTRQDEEVKLTAAFDCMGQNL